MAEKYTRQTTSQVLKAFYLELFGRKQSQGGFQALME